MNLIYFLPNQQHQEIPAFLCGEMFQQLTDDPEAAVLEEEIQYLQELQEIGEEDSHPVINPKDPKCQIKDCL